jgi:hypothetical protein
MKRIAMMLIVTCGVMSAQGAESHATFTLPSGVRVEITEANFEGSGFATSGCSGQGEECRINGSVPFGSAQRIPKTYVKAITVSYENKSYSLDASNMYDAWGTRSLEHKGIVRYFGGKCFNQDNCHFRGLFSDAAGSFVAEWQVVDGLPIRTILTDSNDVVNLFSKNIDPPEFN